MRYPPLVALIVVAALAGCGSVAGVTTGGKAHGKRAPNHIPRIRATCPKSDRQKAVSRAPGAEAALVPPHPRAALLCRYSGLNGHPRFALSSRRTITNSATIARLAHELDALPKLTPGAVNCPADFGTTVLAFFGYASGRVAPVTVSLGGCQEVTNGHVHRLAAMARSPVVGHLAALAGP